MNLLEKLNPKQREAAVTIDGPLLVLAGAGSGKTSTMTHRIAYMIEQGISPYNILAVTFTNKAAKEMKDRVYALAGEQRDMWILTFHSLSLRLLRYHGEHIGYTSNFVVYDGNDQKTLIKNLMKAYGYNDKEYKPAYILAAISKCKEREITPEEFKNQDSYGLARAKNEMIYILYREYEKKLKANNAMDFDDLLLNAVRLLIKEPSILKKYQDRFQYIMVDEYQDTNHIQYKLIKLLSEVHENLCVVGDDDQCIYQWRGADIRNILEFEKDFPSAKVIKLEQNYRSVSNILDAAHSVIENNSGRKRKRLWTDKGEGKKVHYSRVENEIEEANFVADKILQLESTYPRYNDFAILYRTNAQSRQFEMAMTKKSVPCRVLSGHKYYDRKEIKDLIAYMRLVINPKDDISLRRIINEPKRGIGPKTIEKISLLSIERGESMLETISDEDILDKFSGNIKIALKKLVETIEVCHNAFDDMMVIDIYNYLLVNTGYLESLEKSDSIDAETRIENLMEFKSAIYDYERDAEKPSLSDFLENITLMAEVDNHDEEENAVVLMTMHSAKGLEFPVVFMPGLEDGLFPGHRALDDNKAMEEERRLCYVGMTRAKERLFLTSASSRMLYGNRSNFNRESTFLKEIDKNLIEGDLPYSGAKSRRATSSGITGPGVPTGNIDGRYRGSKYQRPFDTLKYSTAETKGKAESFDIREDDRVFHKKFGQGTVIEANSKVITVIFDDGEKRKLAKGIAPIKKL